MAIRAHVKDRDSHPPEDGDPPVAFDRVVGEAVDLVEHLFTVHSGKSEHAAPPSLQPHCEVVQGHLRKHATLAAARVDVGQREHAVKHRAHDAHGAFGVGRTLEHELAVRLLVRGPVLLVSPPPRCLACADTDVSLYVSLALK